MSLIPTSYSGISVEDALSKVNILCDLSYKFGNENNLEDLHKALKQIIGLFFNCQPARYSISETLLKLKFAEFAVSTMKRLNNCGVFSSDDIWFSTFYFYNICWNYSEVNSKLASSLYEHGISGLLIINIMHKPYVENIAKKNVFHLMKTTLCIILNIVRVPDNRVGFISEKVISSLLLLGKGKDLIAVLATLCLGFIACNENVVSTSEFDIYFNIKLVIFFVKTALQSDNKHKGFTMLEFLEVIRTSSLCEIQRNAILTLGGLDFMLDHLRKTKDNRNKIEVLLILSNIIVENNRVRILEVAKLQVSKITSDESENIENLPMESAIQIAKLKSAANHLLWKASMSDNICNEIITGEKVFINFANSDREKAQIIFDKLDCKKIPLMSHENDWDNLKGYYDEASIVIVCVSESFKNASYFVTGTDYCLQQKKVVFPVLVNQSYHPEGWLKKFIKASSDICYNLSTNDAICREWDAFHGAVVSQLTSVQNEASKNMEGNKDNEVNNNSIDMDELLIANISQGNCGSNEINQWLTNHQLSHLQSKMQDMTMKMLISLKEMRNMAPGYYFNALEKHLRLSFTEILQLSYALNSLSEAS